MYNEKIKEMFLGELSKKYTEGTIKLYKSKLESASLTEEILGKDIYEMNLEECKQLLKSYSNRSIDMFNVNRSILDGYKAWCIKEGFDSSLINFFSMISTNDADEYLDHITISKKVITYEELLSFENELENYQDYIYLWMPFIGIYSDKAKAMIDLKVEDIHKDYIQLPNRKIQINDKIYNIFQNAINEIEYVVGNGESESKVGKRTINPTEWVLRCTGSNKFGQVSYDLLQNHIARLKRYLGNNINITNLMLSGKVHLAKQILQEKGEINREDWININKIFGLDDQKAELYLNITKNRVMKYIAL